MIRNRRSSADDLQAMRPLRRAALLLPLLLLAACAGDPPAATDLAAPAPAAPVAGEQEDGAHAEHGSEDEAVVAAPETQHGPGDGHDHTHLDIAESGVGTLLSKGDGFGHRMREVPAGPTPDVALRVTADPAGGWTVQVGASGVQWAPTQVNRPAAAGQAHAHLYAGTRKVARLYAGWSFLGKDAAKAGEVLTVVLYANDHTAWAVDGAPVAASVVLPAPAEGAAL